MGRADRYVHGDHNAICDKCGQKYKFSELRKTWDGFWVCRKDWEARNAQDFVRGVPDIQSVPVTRPESSDVFVAEAWEVFPALNDPTHDTLTLSDLFSRLISKTVPGDTISLAESATTIRVYNTSLSDTLSVAESSTHSITTQNIAPLGAALLGNNTLGM